jgi:hypothetical protein
MAAGFVIGAVTFSIAHPLVKERKELTKIFSLSSSHKKEEKTSDDSIKGSQKMEKRKRSNQMIHLLLVK